MSQDSAPRPLRASDQDRENVINVLRTESVAGRLSNDTFLRRLDLALRARRVTELAELVSDLPSPAGNGGWLGGAVRRWSTWAARIESAWRMPRLPRLVLPRADGVFVIGRSPECDLAVQNMTVSWRHAELRRCADEWLLVDLGSTNGTRVNGWRVGAGFAVRPGDQVSFGSAAFRISD